MDEKESQNTVSDDEGEISKIGAKVEKKQTEGNSTENNFIEGGNHSVEDNRDADLSVEHNISSDEVYQDQFGNPSRSNENENFEDNGGTNYVGS